eukprot:6187965-Pleurochrysis_carterae.AAC.7
MARVGKHPAWQLGRLQASQAAYAAAKAANRAGRICCYRADKKPSQGDSDKWNMLFTVLALADMWPIAMDIDGKCSIVLFTLDSWACSSIPGRLVRGPHRMPLTSADCRPSRRLPRHAPGPSAVHRDWSDCTCA